MHTYLAQRLADFGTIDGEALTDYAPILSRKDKKFQKDDDTKDKARRARLWILLGIALTFIPWAIFAVVMAPFALAYRRYGWVAWTLFALAYLFCCVCAILWRGRIGGVPLFWLLLGLLCGLAATLAAVLGMFDYTMNTELWSVHQVLRRYNNVRADENPGAYPDAGVLSFESNAWLDVNSAGGQLINGVVYCVAPVRRNTSTGQIDTSALTGYWAVGTGCCDVSPNPPAFSCNDAELSATKTGFVLISDADRESYMAVLERTAAVNHLNAAVQPTFLRWVANTHELQSGYWAQARNFYLISIAVAAVAFISMGTLALFPVRRQAKREEAMHRFD